MEVPQIVDPVRTPPVEVVPVAVLPVEVVPVLVVPVLLTLPVAVLPVEVIPVEVVDPLPEVVLPVHVVSAKSAGARVATDRATQRIICFFIIMRLKYKVRIVCHKNIYFQSLRLFIFRKITLAPRKIHILKNTEIDG